MNSKPGIFTGLKSIHSFFILILIGLQFSCIAQINSKVQTISLDGSWDIIFDDENRGIQNNWVTNEEFEKQEFRKIDVPSCWESFEKDYEGVGIYRRTFDVPENWTDRIIELHFDAVNYKSEIWVNDQVVGFHEGGYTPFSFRVDKLIKPGEENTLIVRVISPIILTDKKIDGLGRQEVPMWRGAITGGIWQSVSLKSKGTIGLKDVFIQPKITSETVTFDLQIDNYSTSNGNSDLIIKILDKEGITVVSKTSALEITPGTSKFSFELAIENPQLWSLETPYLYKAEVSLKENDVISDFFDSRFGMREFTVENNEFYLNGKPLYLKAAFFEGLYPVGLAYPDSEEMAIKEIQLAKEAGFNMIRPWRKPAPQMWLDLCDEMGMLTVGSLVVECMHRPISTPRLPFVVENELRKTILSNRNRTCIVQWELFNEINRPILAQMLNSMSLLARELDPTRMILDESGGWGEGANIYLPYEKVPMKFNDIHHYSGSQIHEEEFNGYMVTGRSKDDKKALGMDGVKTYGKNVLPGVMSYISELGYGSTPNLTLNNQSFQQKGNPIVAPTIYHKELEKGYEKALKATKFDQVYPKIEDFYLEQQKMHGIANKRMLEATRLNPIVKGYCIHALTGGDWVLGAGLLDLWRNPKTLVYDLTKEANQQQITPIRILPRNVYADKGTLLEIHGVNELESEHVEVIIDIISENGTSVFQQKLNRDFKNGISQLFNTKLETKNFNGNYKVVVLIKNKRGKTISKNTQHFDVFNADRLKIPEQRIAVLDPENSLTDFLEKKDIKVVPFTTELDKRIPVIVGASPKNNKNFQQSLQNLRSFVNSGGKALILEVTGKMVKGRFRKLEKVASDQLPFGVELHGAWQTKGAWAAKSHVVTDHPVFKDLPTNQIMHGVYENVHPEKSMSMIDGNYIAGMIGYDHFPNMDIMIRHYNGTGDVWWAADVLEEQIGEGKILMSTLQIIKNLKEDPVAEKILFNMIQYLAN